MQAGRLRHQVTIQHRVEASPQQFGTGEPDTSWSAYLTGVWASVDPLRGRELFAAQEHHSEIEVRIRIRYQEGITAAMRVVFESQYYDILAIIDPEMRHRELQLMCKLGVNEG